ncbi:MAG: thioredoxin [archaeon]
MAGNDNAPELTNGDFDNFIGSGLALVDFFAEWCMPCIMMGPIIDEVSEKMKGKVKIGKVNTGDHPDLARKFDVTSIPNMVLFKDGKPIDRFIGSMSADELIEKLEKYVK